MCHRIALAIASVLAPPALASAHPGHGVDPSGTSLFHALGEPQHALPLLGAACIAALLWRLARRRRAS